MVSHIIVKLNVIDADIIDNLRDIFENTNTILYINA